MRFARLDLTRYGRFTDRTLDFGAKPANGSDLHIVYGLNEAGKSTTAAAILDLLFGMERETPYGAGKGRAASPDWHAYSALKIGARLELSGGAIDVARLKRDRNTLIDAENRPLDEALLKAELGGLDRAAFRTMFSLDDDSLEKGGEAILASRGDLGQLLFSASAGLAELGGRLAALREETERFFKPRAHKTELAEKKRALEALKAERERIDTLAATYAELVRRHAEAQGAYDGSAKAIGERSARSAAIERLLRGGPPLAALRQAEAGLAALGDLPAAPEGWREDAAKLEGEAIRLAAHKESAERAIAALERELASMTDDSAALRLAAHVEGRTWRERRSRFVGAMDIFVRKGERDHLRARIAEILRQLGREAYAAPAKLILPVATVGALEDLMGERSGIAAKLAAARAARDEATSAAAEADMDAKGAQSGGEAIEALKSVLQKARRDDSAARLRTMREDRERAGRQLTDALAALAPWRDYPEALAAVDVPDEAETASLRQRTVETQSEWTNARKRLVERTGEVERLKIEAAGGASADLMTDQAAAALRTAREAAWTEHRATLDGPTADAFEAALRRDDSASGLRIAHAREIAASRERARRLAVAEAGCNQARGEVAAAEASIQATSREVSALLPFVAPTTRNRLAFVEAWRGRRREALAQMAKLGAMKEEARRVNVVAERTRKALGAALTAAGAPYDPEFAADAMMEKAEAAIGAEARFAALRQKAKERRAEAARAESRLKAAEEDDARWRSAWRAACADSWLGESGAPPQAGAIRQTLKALDALREAMKACADLDHRIEAMEHDKRLFRDEVAEALAALAAQARDGDPKLSDGGLEDDRMRDEDAIREADAIEARIARALENERRRKDKAADALNARDGLAGIEERLQVNARLAAAMTDRFAVSSLAEVAEKLDACRRRDALRDDVARATRDILSAGVADGFDAACAALERAEPDALAEELAGLQARQADDVAANAERFAALSQASQRLAAIGGDDAVARLDEQRRTILEEIKEGARRYLSLRAGIAAAEAALLLYRERHRGAMMERASRAFCEISRGAYRGLAAEPDGDREVLIALAADGGSKTAEQLSKGARFQLYLALRVAGYHELARTRVPAPFVADDIMETFDHFRAEDALKLFAEMARVGQVIYFTHHLHLAEIAKRVCPEARVHELR